MDSIDFSIGILLIILGILIIAYYEYHTKNKNRFVFKLKIGGIGMNMIGIALIIRELKYLFR